ncbi:MAG: hypothetical protein LEGION0403_FIIPPAGN_01646 [Legionella sp.]
MFFKLLPPSTIMKEIPKATSKFKQINWSLIKKSTNENKLSLSAQTIVNELENASSCDVPSAPILKK